MSRMLSFVTVTLAMVAMASSAVVPRQLNCQECVKEMHAIDLLVKAGAKPIEVRSSLNSIKSCKDKAFFKDHE